VQINYIVNNKKLIPLLKEIYRYRKNRNHWKYNPH